MRLVPSVLLVLIFLASYQSNGWRGITPLRSTCEDVKKALKVDTCTLPISQYTLPEFRIMIEFENETCDSAPRAWRVPKGTVLAVTLSPRNEMRPAEFGLDLSKYRKRQDGEIVGVEHYTNEQEGITVDLYQGFIQNLIYYPRKSDQMLRCRPLK